MKQASGEGSMDDTATISTYQRIVALEDKLDEIENIIKGVEMTARIITNRPLELVCNNLLEVLAEFKSSSTSGHSAQ